MCYTQYVTIPMFVVVGTWNVRRILYTVRCAKCYWYSDSEISDFVDPVSISTFTYTGFQYYSCTLCKPQFSVLRSSMLAVVFADANGSPCCYDIFLPDVPIFALVTHIFLVRKTLCFMVTATTTTFDFLEGLFFSILLNPSFHHASTQN